MRFYIVLLVICSTLLHQARSLEAGATASLDVGVAQQAKSVYWNKVMELLKKVKMPDINFHHGQIHDNSFFIQQDSKNVQIATLPAKNGLRLGVNDLTAGFKSNQFKYKILFLWAKGSVEVTMSEVQVGVTVGLTTQKLANGRVVPAFTAQDIQVSIPSKHLKISLHGNWISKIANAFKNLFKKTIIHQIEGQLRTNIEQNLPKALDELIAKQNGDSELYHDMALDWSLPYGPKVTQNDLQFGIKGLFFKRDQPEVEPVAKPPTNMPLIDTSSQAKFQAYVSTYLMESLSSTFLETNEIHFWTHSSAVPKKFLIQLNTSSLGKFIPGLLAKYGENKPIDLEYKLEKVGNFSIRENDKTLSFDGSVSLKFWVETAPGKKDMAIDVKVTGNHFNFTVDIPQNSLDVTINVDQVSLGDVNINFITFQDFDLKSIISLINEGINIGMPYLNIYLQTLKIMIPQKLFNIFQLSDLTLKYHNDYLEAGLTPTFLPIAEDIPGVYSKFVPLTFADFEVEFEDFTTFMVETIDTSDDTYSYHYTKRYTYLNYLYEQMWQNMMW